MTGPRGITRREFLERAGGGVVMLLAAAPSRAIAQQPAQVYPQDFNAYLVVGRDGRVTVFSPKIEMGQGVLTSQAQIVAEELRVDLDAIDMVLGDTDRCPWDMGTFGSLTTRMFGPALRAAAAQARAALLSLGAAHLGTPIDKLEAAHGIVSVIGAAERRVGYGELSRGARLLQVVDHEAVLRAAADFDVMGRSPLRLDAREKVTGAALYAADVRRPGMLYARLLRAPAHGATLRDVDTRDAEAQPGVIVVRDSGLVAVLHADPEAADRAFERMRAEWRPSASRLDAETIFDHLQHTPAPEKTTLARGNLDVGIAAATQRLRTTYRKGYVAHAPIETHAALAEWRDGRMTVWVSTQTPFPTRDQIAQRLALDKSAVRVLVPYVGGAFGGKSASGQAVEAALLARRVGRPVQVARTREEEFFLDTFDPACVVTIDSGLDAHGRIVHWDATVFAAGERGSALPYDVPNARVRLVGRTSFGEPADGTGVHPFATGPWRAPGANMNVFAIESQIDALAAAAGVDPLEFRLRHLSDTRLRRVLETGATAFGWPAHVGSSGRGIGVACGQDAGTCVAAFAQARVDRATGHVQVERVVCAQDMGLVVNPTGARMQMEGAITMGLGYALSEELRFRDGEILDHNFDTYRIPRFRDLPRIETLLVPNDALAPQGGGEPAVTCVGAVIANALADAIGARVDRLPATPERVQRLLASVSSSTAAAAGHAGGVEHDLQQQHAGVLD
ncbi:MAG: molybdopterin cofactor-binding domain-containing protein [Ramlibacter sp.]